MVGSGFPYAEFLPEEGQARGVQIDLDPTMLSIRYPMEVNLTGDAGATLSALLPLLEQNSDTSWRETIVGWLDDWWKTLEARAKANPDQSNANRLRMDTILAFLNREKDRRAKVKAQGIERDGQGRGQ